LHNDPFINFLRAVDVGDPFSARADWEVDARRVALREFVLQRGPWWPS
jgi:hypothetical protein